LLRAYRRVWSRHAADFFERAVYGAAPFRDSDEGANGRNGDGCGGNGDGTHGSRDGPSEAADLILAHFRAAAAAGPSCGGSSGGAAAGDSAAAALRAAGHLLAAGRSAAAHGACAQGLALLRRATSLLDDAAAAAAAAEVVEVGRDKLGAVVCCRTAELLVDLGPAVLTVCGPGSAAAAALYFGVRRLLPQRARGAAGPLDAFAATGLCAALGVCGRHAEAIRVAAALVVRAAAPTERTAGWSALAVALLRGGNPAQALLCARRLLRANPVAAAWLPLKRSHCDNNFSDESVFGGRSGGDGGGEFYEREPDGIPDEPALPVSDPRGGDCGEDFDGGGVQESCCSSRDDVFSEGLHDPVLRRALLPPPSDPRLRSLEIGWQRDSLLRKRAPRPVGSSSVAENTSATCEERRGLVNGVVVEVMALAVIAAALHRLRLFDEAADASAAAATAAAACGHPATHCQVQLLRP
jgi:hypothetical protein